MGYRVSQIPVTFAEIKKRLDPSFSYMVFEDDCEKEGRHFFRLLSKLLNGLGSRVMEQVVYREKAGTGLYFVVKIDPVLGESIEQEVLSIKLPKNIVLYFFREIAGMAGPGITGTL